MAITDYGVKGLIYKGLVQTPMSSQLEKLAQTVESMLPAGSVERLDFLGNVPALREWVGPRSAKKVIQTLHSATLKKYEGTAEIALDLVRGDKTSQVAKIGGQLVARASQWRAKQLATFVNNAAATTSGVCFDGLSYFNDSHVWNGQTYDNNISHAAATGTTPTANEAADGISEAIQALWSFVDDQGEPINEDMTDILVVVGPTNAATHLQAVSNSELDTGTGTRDNPLNAYTKLGIKVTMMTSPRITLADKCAVFNVSPNACPMVFVENLR
jgi:hypothetical protein